MDSSALVKLGEVVGQIRDPRVTNRSDHLLVDIVGITMLALLCGADDFVTVASFARERRVWLAGFFELPLGIPSLDTFGRVLGLLDPKAFSAALVNWTAALQTALKRRHVAIDGKTARGSASKAKGVRALHLAPL